jgi:DNA replication protein DnaC
MLQEPMMQKLVAMRLHGMVDALKAQEQDASARELSFLERLALLVDHQWNWRQNQALARRLHAAKLRGNAYVEDIDFRASRGLDKSVIRALAQESAWARNHEHLFVLGPTGVGKSFVACALAQKAAGMDTPLCTPEPQRCSAIWLSLAWTVACACCWRN